MGGGAKAFAFIGVTYPEGSTCTCSDGSKTLKLKDTSGQGFFLIPYAAVWTVTASDGTNTKAQSVEITSEGQSVNLSIAYILDLWDYARDGLQGLKDISIPDKYYTDTTNTYRERTNCAYITNNVGGRKVGIIFPNINIADYKTIKITGYGTQGGFGITDAADSVNLIASFRFSSNSALEEKSLPITVSSGYLCSWSDVPTTATYVNVSKILLE